LVLRSYSLLSILAFTYILISVGGKIKWLLEDLITHSTVLSEFWNTKAMNSIVMSLLSLIVGLTFCIPLRNLYLTDLADQEDKIVEEISRQGLQNENKVYFSINVDWLLVFYFSVLNISFLLSFSYCSATVIDFMREELNQQFTIPDNQNKVGAVPPKYLNV
jgi:membrane-anchored glycerophosphoryl diester phosphodiesterase (GDPDase)